MECQESLLKTCFLWQLHRLSMQPSKSWETIHHPREGLKFHKIPITSMIGKWLHPICQYLWWAIRDPPLPTVTVRQLDLSVKIKLRTLLACREPLCRWWWLDRTQTTKKVRQWVSRIWSCFLIRPMIQIIRDRRHKLTSKYLYQLNQDWIKQEIMLHQIRKARILIIIYK